MSKSLLFATTTTIFLAATLSVSTAQEATQPRVQPVGRGAAAEAPVPPPARTAKPLPPGPPAGGQAAFLSTPVMIAGTSAVTAAVLCPFVCLSSTTTTTTTTSTTVTRH